MPNRRIKSSARGGSVQLTDMLRSLFALELVYPSPEIYLISPCINNVLLISNRFGQFRAVMGDNGESDLRIATLFTALAERGTKIRIMYRAHPPTEEFLSTLPESIKRRKSDRLSENGLVTQYFYLRGSMDFTYSGINLNDESVELTTEQEDISLALLEAQQRWEEFAE